MKTEIVIRGLQAWRLLKLQEIEACMQEAAEDYRGATEDLGIAFRNSDLVAADVVQILWNDLEQAAIQFAKLESEHERLLRLSIPELAVEFKRAKHERLFISLH